jgi:hypothetical protein
VRRSTFKVLATIAVVAALVVPTASAGRARQTTVRVKLALLPLSKAQIGLRKVDGPFPIAQDSGPVTNVAAAEMSLTGTPATFKKLGRVGGYTLAYGHAFGGCGCMTRIQTSVERYKTAADAKNALAFWKNDDAQVVRLNVESGFTVDAHRFSNGAGHAGTSRFKYFVEYNAGPSGGAAQVVDERFADGKYVGQVETYSGTQTPALPVAPLAEKLDKRLQLALAGRLHARAVRLPPKLKAGPPPGGPDLSTLGLQTTDLAPGSATLGNHAYFVDPLALSEYEITFQPGGRYAAVGQKIEWYSSASEAAFRSVYDEAFSAAVVASRVQQPTITSVNLDGIRFGERGTIVSVSGLSLAIVALASGQATDLVVARSQTPIQPPDVQDLAQSMQTRLLSPDAARVMRSGLGVEQLL